jgi:hypothetical protein
VTGFVVLPGRAFYAVTVMDLSFLPIYTAFAAVSSLVALGYLSCMSLVAAVRATMWRLRFSKRPASCRPGEVVHQALKVTGRRWDHHVNATVLFGVLFITLVVLGRRDWLPDMALRIWTVLALAMLIPLGFALTKLLHLLSYRMRLARLLEIHVAVAKRLTEAQLRGNRIYHSVPVHDAIIDNVVVGNNGVYTVQLLPPPFVNCDSVRIEGGALVFRPGDLRWELRQYRYAVAALASALSEATGATRKVLPVIVVPGCRIMPTNDDSVLLVSIESCTAFVGWKDPDAYLMTDEIEAIHGWLSEQLLGHQARTRRALTHSLDGMLERPALV